jgi:hypothetical protein
MNKRFCHLAHAICVAALLSGCVTAPATLYHWGSYEQEVYGHFKGESPQAQVDRLEAQLQTTAAWGGTPPPGLHGMLGLLYTRLGKTDQGIAALEREKALFPESAPYINRLLARAGN